MTAFDLAIAALSLAVLNLCALALLARRVARNAAAAATALDDTRHEFEVGLQILQDRIRPRRRSIEKIQDHEGT